MQPGILVGVGKVEGGCREGGVGKVEGKIGGSILVFKFKPALNENAPCGRE